MSRYPVLKPALTVDPAKAVHCADILKAVAHPLRLRIVAILCQGPENVTGLAERLGESQAIVSQQLRILRMRGLVGAERENGFAEYRLLEPNLRDLVGSMERCSVR
jgi:DNA-binding transcriptional ArsR family regulator